MPSKLIHSAMGERCLLLGLCSIATVSQQLSGPPTGQQTRAGWEATIKTLEQLGLLARPITVDEVAIFN